ncbi:MAG: hypothetical protein WCG83_04165 [Candidatus Peregrinibacteria bacterium]
MAPRADDQRKNGRAGTSEVPEQFDGKLDQIAQLLDGGRENDAAERARLAVSLTNTKDREILASSIADRLIELKDQLERNAVYHHDFFEVQPGEDLLTHIRTVVDERIGRQILNEANRGTFASSLAEAIAHDPEALTKIQQYYPDFTWDPKQGDEALVHALEQRFVKDFSDQAEALKKELELEAEVALEKSDVLERVKDKKGMFTWATEKVKAIWAKKSVRVATYVVVGVAATLLIAWGASYLLAYLQGLHAAALEGTAAAIEGATEAGGALAPVSGLEGAGSVITGGLPSAPPIPNIWIGEPVL